MSKKKKELQINYLISFLSADSFAGILISGGRMVLEIENKGAFNTIAQKLFGNPDIRRYIWMTMAHFIWPLIDGRKTVEDIVALVKDEFGEKAEPLYPRIVKYFQIMESYHFVNFNLISLKNKVRIRAEQSFMDCCRSCSLWKNNYGTVIKRYLWLIFMKV